MEKIQVKPDWADLDSKDIGIDIECLALCEALNRFPGIETVESCCGHGNNPFRIWFVPESLQSLPAVVYFCDKCHNSFDNWNVTVRTDCAMSPVLFMVQGPTGQQAYDEAKEIANLMDAWTEEKFGL